MEEIENRVNNLIPDPNTLFDIDGSLIATFSSITDVNQFCNSYNYSNKYNGLKLGQRIQINDGVYNKDWIIAGFDCEANNIAADGNHNNNGYGICLIPTYFLEPSVQYNISSQSLVTYISSTIHTSTLPTVADNLKNVLGSHLINRNVLLSSGFANGESYPNSYTWTTAYCTLPSFQQYNQNLDMTYEPIYNLGEANYVFPIYNFDYKFYSTYYCWSRRLYRMSGGNPPYRSTAIRISNSGSTYAEVSDYHYLRPMIYIR